MAFDFSKLNVFKKLDARARVLVLLFGVIGLILLVYVGTKYLGGDQRAIGPSRIASAPAGMQSIPGGTSPTAEYQRALNQANVQTAEAAKMSGSSAIPTQINTGIAMGASCVICSDQSANVKNLLDQWVREGKISPDVADQLEELAAKNVSPEEYAAALDRLVREGKLTPEQARALLEEYKKQHGNAVLGESAKLMDSMIKSGQLPIDVANQLLDAQKKGMSVSDYAALLQKLVREGKLSPAAAQRLLQQYSKQCLVDATARHVALLEQMQANGTLTGGVAKNLILLVNDNTSADTYGSQMSTLVSQGRLTPAAAGSILDAYRKGKAACGSSGTLNDLIQQAENAAYQEVRDLLAENKISPETGAQITSMVQNDVPMEDFKSAIAQMVQDKKLTPEIAKLKVGDYQRVKELRDAQDQLSDLQANNATPTEYQDMLKKLVAAGVITPEQAAQLMQEYQALGSRMASVPTNATGAFGALQQRVAQGGGTAPVTASAGEFAAAQTAVVQETEQDRMNRLASLTSAMSNQAQQLISSWTPPVMIHREGTPATTTKDAGAKGAAGAASGATGGAANNSESSLYDTNNAPLIKAGTIIFGVLDTAINSDYPDSPVMVSVVDGQFKGAKLLGKIVTTKGISGQMDRVTLNLTLMNEDAWTKSLTVTAYAIDPDTARTVLASSVDYHWMQRYGAMIATSFMQGYASSITNAGTSTTGIFGTSTTHPDLSQSSKILVGLGQVGQTIGNQTQNYINRPPTVRVDSGVSLGILFMSDVTP